MQRAERDPNRFPASVDEHDLGLLVQGKHERLYEKLGAHRRNIAGVDGVSFAVWAPAARSVRVVGDGDGDGSLSHPMRRLDPGGIWEAFVPAVPEGARYRYEVETADGRRLEKTDPVAFATQAAPGTASLVFSSHYRFGDDRWMQERATRDHTRSPLSIYEVHLGSWRRDKNDQPLTYRELASTLPGYCEQMGFTHVEFLPVAEHPFGGSWGYQTTNYFAPTARFGDPDDFRHLVDACHRAGIGVIVDWVPAHFPKDEWALARFDGSLLYEDPDPLRREHPDWGTVVFDYGAPMVRNFLISSTLFWAERFHVDGFRVDAVASMLYLDYSRKKGEWRPNRLGGPQNLEAMAFITELTTKLHARHPDVLMIAEESAAWPGVTKPVPEGGLGFDFKWNLGWMHDTLQHFRRETSLRRHHQADLTFTVMYAWSEHFILPLSHDEVVHGKGSLIRKMAGDKHRRLALLKCLLAYMWAYPGKKLLFMGGEIAQEREWNHDSSIDWDLLSDRDHAGVQQLVRDLNRLYRESSSLWEEDPSPQGTRWTSEPDAQNNVVSFWRSDSSGDEHLICVCNLAPVMRRGFRIGMPRSGAFREVLNTDAEPYAGAGITNAGEIVAAAEPGQAMTHSALVTLPPHAALWLRG
jgi:1,4-alpha-glucan branching enzyme